MSYFLGKHSVNICNASSSAQRIRPLILALAAAFGGTAAFAAKVDPIDLEHLQKQASLHGAAPVMVRVTPGGVLEAGADPYGYRSARAW